MLSKNIFNSNERVSMTASAINVLSDPVPLSSIKVNSVKMAGESKNSFEGLFEKQGQTLSLDLSDTIKNPGVYTMSLDIHVEGRKKALSTVPIAFSIVRPVVVKDVHVGVTDDKHLEVSKLDAVKTENTLPFLSVSASEFDNFHVAFSIAPSNLKMHQAFVRFTNLDLGEEVVFICRDNAGYMHTSISLGVESESFSYASGVYTVSILVGDTRALAAVEWIIGSVALSFPSKPVRSHPLYAKSLLHTSDYTLKALPEIVHKMRPPAERASFFVSSLFTFLTLLPLVVFIVFVCSLKLNTNRLNSLSSILFLCCVALAILLYSGYWFGLAGFSFYQVIKYICFLAPVTAVIGRSALGHLIHVRELEEQEEQKKAL